MRAQTLRLYNGPEECGVKASSRANLDGTPTVTAPVSEVLPLLADAVRSQRAWLEDFADDEITLSADLYEVLIAYRFLRRPVA